jgi:two-component system OmpR family sensor kinase
MSASLLEQCNRAFVAAGPGPGREAQRASELSALRGASLIGLGVLAIASAGLGWLASGRALRPVRSITEAARRASELRLGQRLALTGPDDELKQLADTFDLMLERLDAAFTSQKRFVANAAHELRTPLAAVRLRLQTALDRDLARTDVQAALDALATFGHRADKLLQLSRAESSDAFARQSVDLVQIAATVAEEFWSSEAARRRLDLEIAETGVVAARGDVDSLAIALRNLVENALRYGGDARVAIEVVAPCVLVVRDDGPGVPASTLETLRHRHVRHSRDAVGYGLGLSIVGTIVDKHDGRLELSSPPPGRPRGFEARITLRPATPSTDGP